MTDEYELAALWHHILPYANHDYAPTCSKCGSIETPVLPEKLYYLCAQCHPESHTSHLPK